MKTVSLNFFQTLTQYGLQRVLPTIFQYYTFLSFKHSDYKLPTDSVVCSNSVTVYADGLTIVHVDIYVNGVSYVSQGVNITTGHNQVFNNSVFTQGSTITVDVSIYGQGAAPRMGSLEIQDPFLCRQYTPGATHGSITGDKPCATMIINASHASGCS